MKRKKLSVSDNKLKILRFIFRQKEATRADLSDYTGLSALTITKLVASLMDQGLLVEDGSVSFGLGRRRSILKINPAHFLTLGVDIGFYSVKLGVVAFNGSLIEKRMLEGYPHPQTEGFAFDRLIASIQELIEKYGAERFLGVGVGVSGIVSFGEGKVVFCPNIGGMDDLPLKRHIGESTGLPVLVDTSARCMALGERHMGAGFNIDDQIFLSLGYGTIAAGIITGGRLTRGADGLAGEIGHSRVAGDPNPERCTCGNRGCLELTATLSMAMMKLERELSGYSGYSIAKNLMNGGPLTPQILARAYRAGDKIVCAHIGRISRAVGALLADCVNLLNPRLIVVGGGFAEQLPELVLLIEREIKDRCLILARQQLAVKKSALGTDAPILGGAMLVIDDYLG